MIDNAHIEQKIKELQDIPLGYKPAADVLLFSSDGTDVCRLIFDPSGDVAKREVPAHA